MSAWLVLPNSGSTGPGYEAGGAARLFVDLLVHLLDLSPEEIYGDGLVGSRPIELQCNDVVTQIFTDSVELVRERSTLEADTFVCSLRSVDHSHKLIIYS